MFRSKIFTLILIVCLPFFDARASEFADKFPKIYTGINLGYAWSYSRTRMNFPVMQFNQTQSLSSQEFIKGILLGGIKKLGDSKFYTGVELMGSLSSSTTKQKQETQGPNIELKFSPKNSLGAALLTGYAYDNLLAYLKIGAILSTFKTVVDTNIISLENTSRRKRLQGFSIGFGEIMPLTNITNNLYAGFEITHTRYYNSNKLNLLYQNSRPIIFYNFKHTTSNALFFKLIYRIY